MEYHVAISFAGEDRGIAEQIVTLLNSNGVKVFYDYDYQDEIWGKDTYVYLSDIYENQSLFFLPLISSNYAKKCGPGMKSEVLLHEHFVQVKNIFFRLD